MARSRNPRARPQPRREALLKATVEVVGKDGIAGTTHRAVTERAEVPLATASYYFSSIGELISEALREFVHERVRDMALPEQVEDGHTPTPADIASWYTDRVMELPELHRLAFYEVLVNAARSPDLAEPARHALETYRTAATAGLSAVGAPADAKQARAFVALGVGYGLLHLADPEGDDPEQLFHAIRDLFIGQAVAAEDPEEVARRLRGEPADGGEST